MTPEQIDIRVGMVLDVLYSIQTSLRLLLIAAGVLVGLQFMRVMKSSSENPRFWGPKLW